MTSDRPRHLLVLGDQLSRTVGPLAEADPARTTVLMVESRAWARRRRYHAQKLVLVWSAMRHLRDELRAAGFEVAYHVTDVSPADVAREHLDGLPGATLELMEPADLGIADELRAATGERLRILPNALWLTDAGEWDRYLDEARGRPRMEAWYRRQRGRTGWLMADGRPVGRIWNLDRENRSGPPSAGHQWPARPAWPTDATTRSVMDEIRAAFPDAPGALDRFDWPVTRDAALQELAHFLDHHLAGFGTYEDALTEADRWLHHSRLSVPLNLGLLTALEVCEAALGRWADPVAGVPLNAIEGFIRQLLGWREYIRHWYRTGMPALRDRNVLGHDGQLPAVFHDGRTRMRCVGEALRSAHETGWSHHIQRLMVLGNLGLLAGADPRLLTEWFHERYVDAYDWVMVPNVVGMSQFGDGDAFTSKPYVSGGRYIDRMSDHCRRCPYEPARTTGQDACPLSTLYWAFIDRHAHRLMRVGRMLPIVRAWQRRDPVDRRAILDRAREVRDGLRDGTT